MPLLNVLPPEDSWLHLSDFSLNRFGKFLAFAILALGLDLIWGYTGILSLGQGYFSVLGAYCMGMHLMLTIGTESVYGSDLPDFMVWNQVKELPLLLEAVLEFPCRGVRRHPGADVFALRVRVSGIPKPHPRRLLRDHHAGARPVAWLVFNRNETNLGGTNGLTDFKTAARLPALRRRHATRPLHADRAVSRRRLYPLSLDHPIAGRAGVDRRFVTANSASCFPDTRRPTTSCSSSSSLRPWPVWPACSTCRKSASLRRRKSVSCRRWKWSSGWPWAAAGHWLEPSLGAVSVNLGVVCLPIIFRSSGHSSWVDCSSSWCCFFLTD